MVTLGVITTYDKIRSCGLGINPILLEMGKQLIELGCAILRKLRL
ncbi:hypothetical protein GCM10008018_47120 [Paenibacillus marchantiophytorum]|uniref:Uncharacterized protein n=1 Tax=Paenibacillus marchantiophytorum TaxID=1619310 RepID=A0ABQ1F0L7_9BACL|nr:hypothetical protein GCM10008018_47120 [Paenibacillus marchantiophytorum]